MSNKKKELQEDENQIEQKLKEDLGNYLQKEIIEAKSIPVKEAILVGAKRVSYIRGKDFVPVFKENFEEIKNKIKELTKIKIGNEPNDNSLQAFFQIFFEKKILLKITKNEGDKSKYPKQLIIPQKGSISQFEENKYYWINIYSKPTKRPLIYLFLVITVIILGCMFPIWPLKAKVGLLWILLVLLVFILILLILSLLIPLIFTIFGYDAIILPNLLLPEWGKMSWKDRLFNPFFEIEKRNDDWIMIIIRIFLALGFISIIGLAIMFPSFFVKCFKFIKNGSSQLYSFLFKKIVEKNPNQLSTIDRRYDDVINNDF